MARQNIPVTWPQFRRVALRPQWIGVLLLVLAVAAAFAALGRWQLERGIASATPDTGYDTEQVVALEDVAEPQQVIDAEATARLVTVSGSYVADDWITISGRVHDDTSGVWLIGHLETDSGASLVVALGWAPDAESALAAAPAAGEEVDLGGRYIPAESPTADDPESGEQTALATGAFINEWDEVGPVYAGALLSDAAPSGLETIDAPPLAESTQLNWLNIFYAIEWVIFGGFAFYLWYRLVRDTVEDEIEEAAERDASPASV